MNFVADESCAGPVIQALRDAGHDVVAVAETAQGADDVQVLELARNQKRILITEDHDFGLRTRTVLSRRNLAQISQPRAACKASHGLLMRSSDWVPGWKTPSPLSNPGRYALAAGRRPRNAATSQ